MASITTVPIHGPLRETKINAWAVSLAPQSTDNEEFIIGGAYARLLRVSSLFGVAPLRFKPHGDGYVVSISVPMCIYSYIMISSLAAAALYCILTEQLNNMITTDMISLLSYVVVIYFFITMAIGVYAAPHRMKRLLKCMKTIALVDQSIDAQYSQVKERKQLRKMLLFILFGTLVIAGDSFYAIEQYKSEKTSWSLIVIRYVTSISSFLSFILNIQFLFTATSVRARFTAVNKVLSLTAKHLSLLYVHEIESPYILNIFSKRLAPVSVQSKTVIMRKSVTGERKLVVSLSDAVRRISFLQGLLCDVVDDINDCYSFILILFVIASLYNLTVGLFFAFMEIYNEYFDKQSLRFIIQLCLWWCVQLLSLLMLVEPCHHTIEEGIKTESIVSRMISESSAQGALSCRLQMFSCQLMMRRVGYKPLDLFTLNRSLVASIFGLVTTHLVILLQFQFQH